MKKIKMSVSKYDGVQVITIRIGGVFGIGGAKIIMSGYDRSSISDIVAAATKMAAEDKAH